MVKKSAKGFSWKGEWGSGENYVVLGSENTVEQAVKRVICQHLKKDTKENEEQAILIWQDPTIASEDNLLLQWCSERCAPRRGSKYSFMAFDTAPQGTQAEETQFI